MPAGEPPAVTVVGAPVPPGQPAPRRWPAVALLAVVAVVLAALAVHDAVRSASRRARASEAAAAARLRFTVLSAVDAGRAGHPGSATQQGVSLVTFRNDSDRTVRVDRLRLDGDGPPWPGPGAVAAHVTARVPVGWPVLCAEVGVQPGPRLLDLDVRLSSATPYRMRVRLDGALTDRAFHAAAVGACDVLVAR